MIATIKTFRPILAIFPVFLLGTNVLFAQMDYEEEAEIREEEIAVPTTPSIYGASPKNGAQNLICNAFISARMDLLDAYQGVDAKSVSEESIKLYPASNPEEAVEIYITINNGLKNILLEPRELLQANTEYIFEINSNLVDLEGVPFETYTSRFKTGTVKLPKHISRNKPKIKVIPAKKRIKLNPLPEGYLIKKPKPKEEKSEPKPTPIIAEKEAEQKAEASQPMTQKEKRDAAVAAKLAEYNAARKKKADEQNKQKENPATKDEAISETKSPVTATESLAVQKETAPLEDKSIGEKEIEDVSLAKSASNETSADPVLKEEKPEEKPLIASISYPAKFVKKDKPLPVKFTMPEPIDIRYLIKNAAGEIVKKGIGKVNRGELTKTIPTKNLPPGKYKIAIKAGDLVENHSFSILK